jgi:predicted Zn-dependent peptidase
MGRKYSILLYITVLFTLLIQVPWLYALDTLRTGESKAQIHSLPKGISIYQLDNGLQVLLIENPAVPMVGVNVVVKVGSAYETFSTSGMSHMLEHLLFNGTTTRMQKQLYDDVDRIGGYNNASTAEFYTNYMMVTPAENIRKGMEIQADMLFNSILPIEKFEKEKGIVLEEISKSLANAQEQLERNATSILFDGHAISLPTLGTYSTIQSLTRDNVYAFYKNNYVPNNMILTAIGSFQTKTMLSWIKEIYGKAIPGLVKHDVFPGWGTGFQVSDLSERQTDIIYNRFYDGQDIVLQLFYQLPQAESSKLFTLIHIVLEKNKDSIQSSLKAEFPQIVKSIKLSTRSSPLKNFVEAVILLNKNTDISSIVNSITTKLAGLNFGLPIETIKSEVTKSRTDFLKNIEKPHMFGIYNSNELVINGIESVIAAYSGNEFYKAAKELETFKLTSNPIIIIQSPSVKKDEEKISASHEIKLFEDETTGKNLIVVQNEVSNLLAIHFLIKHKAVYESRYGKDAAKILHDCFEQRLNSTENQKISSRYGLTFVINDNPFIPMDDIYLHPDFGYIRVEGLADDLPGAIHYLTNQLKNFTPTEEEFKKAVEKFKGISMMLMGGDKAKKLFDETYKSIVYEPDPYSASQPALIYDNLLAFTKKYFQPENMIISVVSPVTPDSINTLFNQFSGTPYIEEPEIYDKKLKLIQKDTVVEKEGKGERSYLFWGFTTQIDPKEAPALQALSLILADEIIFDIREKQAMAYNMSAGIEVIEDKALFYVNQGTRSQNVDKLIPQYPRFFSMSAIDTLTNEKLEKSINMYLGRMMFRRLSSINQAYYLANSFYFRNDFNYDKNFLEELKNVKLSDVKSVAKKYMKVKNPVLVIVR